MEHYDVIIIGGGPAGSIFASKLNCAHLRVLLIEERLLDKEYTDGMKKKPCSGLVSEPAQHVLKMLGLELPQEIKAVPEALGLKIIDCDTGREVTTREKIINVERQKFDRWLFANIPSNVIKQTGARYLKHSVEEGKVIAEFSSQGVTYTVSTTLLVAADGANSGVRANTKPFDKEERYIGAEWMLRVPEKYLDPYFRIILDPHSTDHYLWTIPKDGLLHVGGAFPRSAKNYRQCIAVFEKMGFIPGGAEIADNWAHYIARPVKNDLLFEGEMPVYFIGEAAGFICPISAEGYSYAMLSAFALAVFINKTQVEDLAHKHEFQLNSLRRKIWMQNLKRKIVAQPEVKKAYFKMAGKLIS